MIERMQAQMSKSGGYQKLHGIMEVELGKTSRS